MKIDRLGDKFTSLEKSQMLTIEKLQEKIRILEFDKNKDKEIIRDLKYRISRNKNSINEMIKEIQQIQKKENYIRLNYIITVLGILARQGVNDE